MFDLKHLNDKIMELTREFPTQEQWEFITRIVLSYTGHYPPQGRIDYYKSDYNRFIKAFGVTLEDGDIFTPDQLREMFGNRLDIWSAVKICLGKFMGAQEDHSEGSVYTDEQISAIRNLSISVAWE